MKYSVPAVIFSGGKSSRMGEDKALLPFGSFPTLAQYQYDRLQTLFDHVYISTKQNKFSFDTALIFDKAEESSPLVGLVSVLESLGAEEIFILSVDAPFVDKEIINTLIESASEHTKDAVVASHKGHIQPLCGIYRRSILPAAKESLSRGNHKMKALLEIADTLNISFNDPHAFLNLNRPEEYQHALTLISS